MLFTDVLFGYYYIIYYLYSVFEWLLLVRGTLLNTNYYYISMHQTGAISPGGSTTITNSIGFSCVLYLEAA